MCSLNTSANLAIFTAGMLTVRKKQREHLNSPELSGLVHMLIVWTWETDPRPAEASQQVKLDLLGRSEPPAVTL